MEFEYYTDDIALDKMVVNAEIENPIIDLFIKKINIVYKKLGINPKNKKLFYKRNSKGKSILGIQLDEEDDLTSYLVFDCSVEGQNYNLFCNIDFHADKKISMLAIRVANLIFEDVNSCFEDLEYEFNSDPRTPKEYALMKNIAKKKENLLRRVFGQKQTYQAD